MSEKAVPANAYLLREDEPARPGIVRAFELSRGGQARPHDPPSRPNGREGRVSRSEHRVPGTDAGRVRQHRDVLASVGAGLELMVKTTACPTDARNNEMREVHAQRRGHLGAASTNVALTGSSMIDPARLT